MHSNIQAKVAKGLALPSHLSNALPTHHPKARAASISNAKPENLR